MQALTKFDLSKFYFGAFATVDVSGTQCFLTRTGYTGEDGFEISIPNERMLDIGQKLVAQDGVRLCGAVPPPVPPPALLVPCAARPTAEQPPPRRGRPLAAAADRPLRRRPGQGWARATACAWRRGCACTATT